MYTADTIEVFNERDCMKEIGGYIELDTYSMTMLHENAVALNCGRNCLAYLIKTKKIKKIHLPYFLCASVENICKKYHVEIQYYNIDENFLPKLYRNIEVDEWLYVVNYYGQVQNQKIREWKEKCPRLIVDNSQAYFQMPVDNVDTIYTCRKYFGVADGAFLYTDKHKGEEFERDYSYERMHFLLGRYEKGANEFYREYVANNKQFQDAPILRMSSLTTNLLRGIDYSKVEERRTENFAVLHDLLKKYNMLELSIPNGAFMYPLYIKNGAKIRNKCRENKIYIPILWPDVFETCDDSMLEYDMAENILPIPVDQRYDRNDMKYIVEVIEKCIN